MASAHRLIPRSQLPWPTASASDPMGSTRLCHDRDNPPLCKGEAGVWQGRNGQSFDAPDPTAFAPAGPMHMVGVGPHLDESPWCALGAIDFELSSLVISAGNCVRLGQQRPFSCDGRWVEPSRNPRLAQAGRKRTGTLRGPRTRPRDQLSSAPAASSNWGMRRSHSSMATLSSIRAKFEPMQR